MGVGRRMKKQGMPMSLEDLGVDRKRKTDRSVSAADAPSKRRRKSNDPEPKKLVNLDRARRHEQDDKEKDVSVQEVAQEKGKSKKSKKGLVNSDAQITVPPPMPMTLVEDDEDEALDDDDDDDVEAVALDDAELNEASLSEDEVDELAQAELEEASDSAFDSEEDDAPKTMFSEDEDESDGMERLNLANIEGLSRKLDQEQAQVEAEAQQELEDDALQTNIAGEDGLPDSMEQAAGLAPDLQLLRTRITEATRILGSFSKLADKTKSRADYTQLLLADICAYYGYNPYLAEKLFDLFTPAEAFAFFEANETPRPVVLRTNTLRTNRRTLAQALINRGVVLEPVGKWSKVGLQVFESPVPLGATPEYLAGHYILQAASSFLPVMALAPQPGERVLDMAAAPGGKTTYIAALMRNTGAVFANDANRQRAKGLIGNVHRLGCKNVIVCNYEAQKAFPKILGGFDRILLDAPCSGTGVIGKDPSVKTSKTERDFLALPHMQKQLLLAAIDSVDHNSKTGGYVVYSTCSVTVEENEGVVQYILRKRPNVKIVETGLGTFGSEGFKSYMGKKFDDRMPMTRRYFPHRENVDGFFVCKLKKVGPTPKSGLDAVNGDVGKENGEKANGLTETTGGVGTGEDANGVGGEQDDDFGGFDDEADNAIIERAEKKWLRARGLDPRAADAKSPKTNSKSEPDKKDNNEAVTVSKPSPKKPKPKSKTKTENLQNAEENKSERGKAKEGVLEKTIPAVTTAVDGEKKDTQKSQSKSQSKSKLDSGSKGTENVGEKTKDQK